NDSIGHQGGDELLGMLADRLSMILPPDARFARVGGDEFAVALTGRAALGAVAGVASAMVHALDQSFTVGGFQFQVTAAVGYAISDGGDVTPAELLRRADLAMYQAKNAAERDAVPYHPGLETGALHRKRLGMALRGAIEANELSVVYQPIVRASDLAIVSVEALVRWDSKEFGRVSPVDFIPVAEETGAIHDIGKFVFQRACQDMVDWPGLKMSINVSPVQFRNPGFDRNLAAILAETGLPPARLEVEMTETHLVTFPDRAQHIVASLRILGVSVALDDFGKGYSSIGYLRRFSFDKLKIDRSLVHGVSIDLETRRLCEATVALGRALNLEVTAEGIETEADGEIMRQAGCAYLQGFAFARPMSAAHITELLDDCNNGSDTDEVLRTA
ncbi:MAG: bifunctional diguanylate cyclase/phosphodiesterase, partial [Rhizobiales bacterium]|nr:bifunctional diguanylate cyclase/phosphodiesterase [Hyphomicrobiales bacterium]